MLLAALEAPVPDLLHYSLALLSIATALVMCVDAPPLIDKLQMNVLKTISVKQKFWGKLTSTW